MIEATKRCGRCGLTKPLTNFYRKRASGDGRQGICKVCDRAKVKDWEQRNPEKVEEKRVRFKRRHPEKVRAKWIATTAVHEGRLHKPSSCERCGVSMERSSIHGHHRDHSKPLEVEWLCPGCHARTHQAEAALQAAKKQAGGGAE